MKRLPNNALQKALVPFLRERTGYRVYDYVPENATLPFITLGAVTVQDKSTKTEDMTKASVHIHIYSNYKGRFEINTLAETLINVFASEQIDLSAEEFFVCSQGVEFYETYPEDEIGYSGVITLEALIQNKKEE